ncbi:MAG TPA: hypothetical protein PLQ12_05280, partial [Candidatus Defluviicoccus seviourii]|nr:hypothetical protein [Candidatus Defluviicoccus seviourii]
LKPIGHAPVRGCLAAAHICFNARHQFALIAAYIVERGTQLARGAQLDFGRRSQRGTLPAATVSRNCGPEPHFAMDTEDISKCR